MTQRQIERMHGSENVYCASRATAFRLPAAAAGTAASDLFGSRGTGKHRRPLARSSSRPLAHRSQHPRHGAAAALRALHTHPCFSAFCTVWSGFWLRHSTALQSMAPFKSWAAMPAACCRFLPLLAAAAAAPTDVEAAPKHHKLGRLACWPRTSKCQAFCANGVGAGGQMSAQSGSRLPPSGGRRRGGRRRQAAAAADRMPTGRRSHRWIAPGSPGGAQAVPRAN